MGDALGGALTGQQFVQMQKLGAQERKINLSSC